uniref:Uncharacterized protein n=1 Tax=Pseudomonas phage RVTF4 TaxID=3236931 RepID=A0AB39CDC4_9VIRU
MNRELTRWMNSNEQVHYTEEEIDQLVNKPPDPQYAKVYIVANETSEGGLKTLISTTDLPTDPKEGDTYQVRDVCWTWANGRWMSVDGLYGHV